MLEERTYFEKILHSARHHPRPEKRIEMIRLLGELQDARALPLLSGLLKEPDLYIISEAVEAIGRIGGSEAPSSISRLCRTMHRSW